MRLKINGEERELVEGTTVLQMLQGLSILPQQVVVEHNLKILKRAELHQVILQPNDQVEIVHFVGGG
jgi:thiamine biosynthesis protein ThiS